MPWSTKRDTQAMIATAFTQTMDILSNNLRQLILEAESCHSNLEKLEESLSVLHEIVMREDSSINSAKAELLSDLWTKLRLRNRQQVRQHDENLALLTDVAKYRKKALALVVSSLYTLRELSEDIENLRERVVEPDLIGSQVPVVVHIESIKAGLGRLQEGRINSKERQDYFVKKIMSNA
ncbi:hypothetical protein PC9H_009774 [Pleurotus ostreatus]|uniref:Uncharacterized protein n=1 Tax=Pleurotus ostreatus TaxID=5322 RepID=A0A8H7DPX8_PLEOS|nr:uncharacterized protein PC9H_009774 [Pleurotus ostreatus]KAF7424467.1 hypothetical protein PC9H_009774 [Pleurotus ostreatus]